MLYSEKVADRYSFGYPKTHEEAQGRTQQHPVPKGNRPPPAIFKREAAPKEYEPSCAKREDYDLCLERRMAVSAAEQTRLNIVGVILLFLTLGATTAAARYAKQAAQATNVGALADQESAKAAISTLELMDKTSRRHLRAYAGIENIIADIVKNRPQAKGETYRQEFRTDPRQKI